MTKKQKTVDSVFLKRKEVNIQPDWPLANFIKKHKNSSFLFSQRAKTKNFSTDNLYIHFVKSDRRPDFRSLDGFLKFEEKLTVKYAFGNRHEIYKTILETYGGYRAYFREVMKRPFEGMSRVKMWNVSIVGSLVVGMFLMTFIYRYLGQNAAAVSIKSGEAVTAQQVLDAEAPRVLGVRDEKDGDEGTGDVSQVENYVSQIMKDYQDKSSSSKELEKEIYAMVGDTPMKQMVPYIAQQDRMVAAFMVGIARQESSWGVHVPVDPEGNDCYNYWGYRGKNPIGTGGHSCFSSPKDAVDTVAKRLKFLVSSEKLTTPGKMVVVWKCGYDCSWDKPSAVNRWVGAVNYYFKKFDNK